MSHHDYSLEELSDITPYENYITAIRDKVTKKKYAGQLEMFLNPNHDWADINGNWSYHNDSCNNFEEERER